MSPATFTPDAFKGAARPCWWTCKVCIPNVHDKGGQSAFYAHYLREHYSEDTP